MLGRVAAAAVEARRGRSERFPSAAVVSEAADAFLSRGVWRLRCRRAVRSPGERAVYIPN